MEFHTNLFKISELKDGRKIYHYRTTNGDYYKGGKQNESLDGFGFLFVKEWGAYFMGDFRKGQFTGLGVLYTPTSVYEGGFVEGKKHGKGYEQVNSTKNTFEGEFNHGVKIGKGYYRYHDGRLLIAEHVGGKRRGSATFYWTNGDRWEGEFISSKQAKGVLTFAKTGDTLAGDFAGMSLSNGKEGEIMTLTRAATGEVIKGHWCDLNFVPLPNEIPTPTKHKQRKLQQLLRKHRQLKRQLKRQKH